MSFQGPREACLALNRVIDELGDPIVEAIKNTRSLTDVEKIYLTSVVDNVLTDAFLGETMNDIRSYIHRPTHFIKKENES